MGRLFWKFFAFIWLAQVAAIVAIGSAYWLTELHRDPDRGERGAAALEGGLPRPPPPPPDAPGDPGRGAPPGLPPDPPAFRNGPPLGPTLATLLASLVTAALIARYVAKPIRSLRYAFEAAATGNLALRVAPLIGDRHDELADLGTQFDRMAERLQQSMDGQRRLLHDVSHEVRSPLARLQAAVGLLRQKRSAEESTIGRIEDEIARIDLLIGDLLRLSRIEAGELGEAVEDVDLQDLVAQIVSDANFEAQASGRMVAWTQPTPAVLRGRPEMLHVAFENVVRNAIKHAPHSEVVTIETHIDAARNYTFRVLDTGPGVPPEELNELFRPFFSLERRGGNGRLWPRTRHRPAQHRGARREDSSAEPDRGRSRRRDRAAARGAPGAEHRMRTDQRGGGSIPSRRCGGPSLTCGGASLRCAAM